MLKVMNRTKAAVKGKPPDCRGRTANALFSIAHGRHQVGHREYRALPSVPSPAYGQQSNLVRRRRRRSIDATPIGMDFDHAPICRTSMGAKRLS